MATHQDSLNMEIVNGIKFEFLTKKQKQQIEQATLKDLIYPQDHHGKASIMNRLKAKHAKKYA